MQRKIVLGGVERQEGNPSITHIAVSTHTSAVRTQKGRNWNFKNQGQPTSATEQERKKSRTRTVNILNSSSSVYRPLGFSFVFNGKPIYFHVINTTLPPKGLLLSRTSLSATKRVVTALITSFTMSTYLPLTPGYLSRNQQLEK